MIYGSVMGSFCCERFGVERFRTLDASRNRCPLRRVPPIHVFLGPARASVCAMVVAAGRSPLRAARWCFAHGYVLYYGDAEAHLEHRAPDARFADAGAGADRHGAGCRCRTLLLIPFVMHDDWWQSGLAGDHSFGRAALRSRRCFCSPRRERALSVASGRLRRDADVCAEPEHAVSAVDADDGAAVRGLRRGAAVGDAVVSRLAIDLGAAAGGAPRRTPHRSRATKAGS